MSRILTTHTGSLPRPKDLLGLLRDREEGRPIAEATLREFARSAVLDVVKKQRERFARAVVSLSLRESSRRVPAPEGSARR